MTKTSRFAAENNSCRAVRGSLLTLLLAGCLVGTACSSSVRGGVNAASDASVQRPSEVVHEPCDISAGSTQKTDVNRDGRADIMVAEGCRAFDLNFDGKVDSWVYLDDAGRPRRREMDFDRDGGVDELHLYTNGLLTQKYRSTARQDQLDTWEFFSAGKLIRTERDSNGDGVVDQWWEYPTPGCPVIRSDIDRDGKPDQDTAVDYCKETGYVPPERAAMKTTTSPSFERPGGSIPEEVENPAEKPDTSSDKVEGSPQGSAEPAGGKKDEP